ncbi:MAG: glycosyltransferase [Acidobacteriia bacterium]|nr:glycosyltransferase [Terriglobia bacterium]
MSKHLAVIFAYHYPPENAIGGARPSRFAKYLSQMGYDCRVFTAAGAESSGDTNIFRIPDPFTADRRRGPGWQAERAIRKLFLPGEMGIRWSACACAAARLKIRAYRRANPGSRVTIFATFPPLGTLLASWRLGRMEGVPWIADFRDPLIEKCAPHGAWRQRRAYQAIERAMVRGAGAVIANTDAAKTMLLEKFPEASGKIRVIWNGFDSEDRVGPLPRASADFRVMSHTGELYAGRTAAPVLESFARLISAGRLPAAGVRVRLIGDAEENSLPNQTFLDRARAEGWLELVTHRIPRNEALRIAQSSDYLLLLQPQSTTQVPGKLFEYVRIGRPILALVRRDSPSERVLARAGVPYRCVYADESPAAVDDAVADFFRLPTADVQPSAWFEETFNAQCQARELDAVMQSLHNEAERAADCLAPVPLRENLAQTHKSWKAASRY